jgi:hypothetical protein
MIDEPGSNAWKWRGTSRTSVIRRNPHSLHTGDTQSKVFSLPHDDPEHNVDIERRS